MKEVSAVTWRPEDDLAEVLIDEVALRQRVIELGRAITTDYVGKSLLLVGILKGSMTFLVDLAREIGLPLELDFVAASSYGAGTESSGIVRMLKDLDDSVDGKHVLMVDDVVDSGLTLSYVARTLLARRPASLAVCVLLVKNQTGQADVALRYVGFEIPNRFVVGYGLDYAEVYRNLPYIAALKLERYARQ